MNTDNFDTNIEEQVSLAKIEGMLLQIGAENIYKKYRDGKCIAVTFLIWNQDMMKMFPFHLEQLFNKKLKSRVLKKIVKHI